MFEGDRRLHALLVEDDFALQSLLISLFSGVEIRTTPVWTNDQAIATIRKIALTRESLDILVTDINHPGPGNGIDLAREVRSLPDESLCAGGLRARHVPIVIHSSYLTPEAVQHLKRIDPGIRFVEKPSSAKELLRSIEAALAEYRDTILAELQVLGLGIVCEGGRYRVLAACREKQLPLIEEKHFVGDLRTIGSGYTHLVLSEDRLAVGERGVEEFEWLLNSPLSTERELHEFFKRNPAFLLGQSHDTYWSEPTLRSDSQILRPDFVLQPLGVRDIPWQWKVVDLKRPQVPLVVGGRFHPDLSQPVHHAVAQLRDYSDFFADPKHATLLRQRFGGVVPQPQAVVVIGRLPGSNRGRFAALRQRVTNVTITTYDEVLECRRAQLERLRVLLDR